eukprot:GFUD01008594.1.p1 GENE.GFUD01008594.1~~GFUD01008594.1.p1  ORF type:complete len:485 (+),score=136.92 GFUD01008594.1:74-1456(+)
MEIKEDEVKSETIWHVEENETKMTTWYVNNEEEEDFENDDVIDYDFIKLSVRHIIKNRKIVNGSILITPRNFIFDPISTDPLDELEPELFQVAFPTKRIKDVKILYDYFSMGNDTSSIYRGPKIQETKNSEIVDEDTLYEKETTEESEESDNEDLPKLTFITEKDSNEDLKKEENSGNENRKDLFINLKMDTENTVTDSGYISSYGSPDLLQSYCFIISSTQAVHAHTFFTTWLNERYINPQDVIDIEELTDVPDFEFVQDFFKKVDTGTATEKSSHARELYKNMSVFSVEMGEESQLLTKDQIKELTHFLPPRCLAHSWTLVFSTWRDGYSLHSLYRNFTKEQGPALLVFKCSKKVTFGALVSDAPRISEKFIGTGESWLFSYKTDKLVTYPWSGENTFIMQGSTTSLVVGSDQDGFGLWFDGNLNLGSSQAVSTFNSDCLTTDQDFVIENVECWSFMH